MLMGDNLTYFLERDGTIPENTFYKYLVTFNDKFCMVLTLDRHHPAHQVLKNSIKDCGFGEPISGCPNRMTFWPKV